MSALLILLYQQLTVLTVPIAMTIANIKLHIKCIWVSFKKKNKTAYKINVHDILKQTAEW